MARKHLINQELCNLHSFILNIELSKATQLSGFFIIYYRFIPT